MDITKYFSIYLLSTLKFVFGPVIGAASGFNVFITAMLTSLGMMTSVFAFTFFGKRLRGLIQRLFGNKERKVFSERNRRFVKIWQKYGVPGVSFLTPLLLTPIGGAILVNALGAKKKDILVYMSISSLFWGLLLSIFFKYFKDLIF